MKHSSLTRFGFTLVEMLTVIAIIGILAALMSGAMVAVRARVQKASISAELKQLEMALEAYKTTYGEYPPDGTDKSAVNRHLAKVYPRAKTSDLSMALGNKLSFQSPNDDNVLNPSNALVFWLAGPIQGNRPIGFSKNPAKPDLGGTDTTTPRSAPLYDFNPAQLTVHGTFATYASKTGGAPYVYFRAKISNNATNYTGSYKSEDSETISAYQKGTVWYGDKRFQIISPGLDGKYGVGGNVAVAVQNANAFDNQTNFGDIEDLAD